MKTQHSSSFVARDMEESQILLSKEDIQFRAIAMCFLISCLVDPVLWMCEKFVLLKRYCKKWLISPNISTTTEPIFTNVSVLVDVCMEIIKLT